MSCLTICTVLACNSASFRSQKSLNCVVIWAILQSERITIEKWSQYVRNCEVTNAIYEGTNYRVKVIKKIGYGGKDDEYFKLSLVGRNDEVVNKE